MKSGPGFKQMSCHSKLRWQVHLSVLKRHYSISLCILLTPKTLNSLILHSELSSPAEIRALSFETSGHKQPQSPML